MKRLSALWVGLVVVVAIIITPYFTIQMAFFQTQQLLIEKIQNHLIAVRDTQKKQIEDYFNRLSHQVLLYAELREIKEAMRHFRDSLPQFQSEVAQNIDKYRHALAEHYHNGVTSQYENSYRAPDFNLILNQLDDNSILWQYHYIVAHQDRQTDGESTVLASSALSSSTLPESSTNPNNQPPRLATLDSSSYSQWHDDYHPRIKSLTDYADAENILLVDSDTGIIVYSLHKAIDFATSLIDGPFAQTSLGTVFNKANQLVEPEVVLVDFSAYLPASDSYRAFVGTPIFEDEQKIGILIFQITIDSINEMMTYNKAWSIEKSGLTGESYLVAADGTMRNDSRLLVEDKEEYLDAIEETGLSSERIEAIKVKNTSVGLQVVDTVGTRAAFAQWIGFDLYEEYHDEFVYSAYAPVDIPELRWAIFATLSENEALEPLEEFALKISYGSMQISVGIFLVGLVGLLLVWPSKSSVRSRAKHPDSVPKTYTIEEIIEHINRL